MTRAWQRAVAPLLVAVLVLSAPALASAASLPVIVLTAWKTTPATLSVGGRFKLDLVIENKAATGGDAKNVIVTVGAAATDTSTAGISGPPQVVALGSNTRYVGTIAAGAKAPTLTFDLISNPRGGPGPFTLPVNIEYDTPDVTGTPHAVVNRGIGLMLTRTLVFDVGSLTYPKETTAGAPFDLSVTVQNTNDFPINGVALKFTSTETSWTSNETTVGVLEAGKAATLKAVGVTQKVGVLPVTMVIGYKDDYNQAKEIRRDFTLSVRPAPAPVEEKQRRNLDGPPLLVFIESLLGLGG